MILNEMTLEEIERKLDLFFKTKTITFIKIRFSNGFHIHNGYIKEIKDSYIMFKDIKDNNTFPIDKKDILKVDVSKGDKNG